MLRRTLAALVSAVLLVPVAAVTAPAAWAAPEPPSGAVSSVDSDGDIHLTWPGADGASAYSLQVATDSSFSSSSLVRSVTTYNRAWIVPDELSTSDGRSLYWRVASFGSATSALTLGAYSEPVRLDLEPTDVPTLVSPGGPLGGVVTYPDPVAFTWTPVSGAQQYRVQWASDAAFTTDVRSVTTTATSYTPAQPLPRMAGDTPITWHWRVQPVLYTGTTTGVTGAYSEPWTFTVEWPAETAQPQLLSPANWTAGAPGISDVQLRWTPVRGAARYEVVIGAGRSDDGRSVTSPVADAGGRTSFTTWVPTVAFADRNLFWQVIPYDRAGNAGTASAVWQFRKLWGAQTGPETAPDADVTYPEPLVGGSAGAPTVMSIDDLELAWNPVPRATLYEVEVVPTNGLPRLTCRTASTSATIIARTVDDVNSREDLAGESQCLWSSTAAHRIVAGATYTWRVRAIDYSGSSTTTLQSLSNPAGTLMSAWSDPEKAGEEARERWFKLTAPHETTATIAEPDTTAWAAGSAVVGQPSPVFSWNTAVYYVNTGTTEAPVLETRPVDGYEVRVALNRDMTNTVAVLWTPSTRLRINGVFRDNQTGMPYYWNVRPLTTTNWTTNVSYRAPASAGTPSWNKASTATAFYADESLNQTTSADGTITFAWQPQAVTAPDDGGSRGYQVTVTTSGGTLIGSAKVEYPSFVAVNPKENTRLADGNYKLTVAPLDANGAPGRPSAERSFTVTAPAPVATAASVAAGSARLTWATEATTSRFVLQYRNVASGVTTTVTTVDGAQLTQSGYTVPDLPAGTYTWQVQSVDAAGNLTSMSAPSTFTIEDRRPTLLTETDQVLTSSNRVLDWEPVPGVSRYLVQVATSSGGLATATPVETRASAYAPTTAVTFGTPYYWRVRAVPEKLLTSTRLILGESLEGRFFAQTAPVAPAGTTPTVSAGGLTFAWGALTTAGAGSAQTVEYVVRYRVKQTPEVDWTVLEPTTATSLALTLLMTSTTYQFEVAGRTDEGQGPWSKTVEKATLSVPSAPTNLQPVAGLRSISLTWTPAASSGTSLTGQTLRYRSTTAETWTTVALSAGTNRYAITGLAPAAVYRIEIVGHNVVGTGPAAAAEQIAIGPATAPQKLVAVRGDRQVKLTWEPASFEGDQLQDYAVEMRSYSASTKTWTSWTLKTATTSRTATISSLANGTTYEFRVYARTVVGKNGTPSAAKAAVPAGKPFAPTGVKAVATSGRITVSWTKAQANGSTVSGYSVKYSLDGKTWTTLPKTTASATSKVWTGPKKGKVYRFRVYTVSNLGTSVASTTVSVTAR